MKETDRAKLVSMLVGRSGRSPRSRVPKAPRVSEKVLQQQIVRFLCNLGARVYVSGTVRRTGDYQGTMQTPGIPDVEAWLPLAPGVASPHARSRVVLKVECKAAGGQLSAAQESYRQLCLEGPVGLHHVVGGLDDVIAWAIDQGYVKAENMPHYRLRQRDPGAR